jgi:hypothetical protein
MAKILFFVILNLIAWAFRLIWGLNDMRKRKTAPISLTKESQLKRRKAA